MQTSNSIQVASMNAHDPMAAKQALPSRAKSPKRQEKAKFQKLEPLHVLNDSETLILSQADPNI